MDRQDVAERVEIPVSHAIDVDRRKLRVRRVDRCLTPVAQEKRTEALYRFVRIRSRNAGDPPRNVRVAVLDYGDVREVRIRDGS